MLQTHLDFPNNSLFQGQQQWDTGAFEPLNYVIYEWSLSLPLFILFVLFDKYGEDSMKRSLYNRLNSQLAYAVITIITFHTPITAWRVFIGPLKSIAADFCSFHKIFLSTQATLGTSNSLLWGRRWGRRRGSISILKKVMSIASTSTVV